MTQLQNGLEHRWGERILIDIPVQLSADKVAGIHGRISNLSLSGALLRCDANLNLHALIEVRIELIQPSLNTARVLAHVSRKRKEDVGIEWCEFAPMVVKDLLRSPSMRLPL
ncbi:MAG: PilZ domain-containing protein [Pseudomonadota bacterium]|nr:PilZ domain-containing protein [Pseudomonadota bacterium]